MKILDHFQHINLTNDQHKTLVELGSFLKSDAHVFMLKGYAGTGKTTLIKGITEFIKKQELTYDLFAPTGRAAMVISGKTKDRATTIHRGIYNLKDFEEKQDENSFFINFKLHLNSSSSRHITLIDEASMISNKFSDDEFFIFGSGHLLNDLFTYVDLENTNRKIIFIGDNAQLPPVNMNFSPALDANYLIEKYGLKVIETTLKQVVRQGEMSKLLKLATEIREQIEKKTYNTLSVKHNSNDIIECKNQEFDDFFKKTAKATGIDDTLIITHSNKLSLEYNHMVRKLRYRSKINVLNKHDKLIITKNNYNYDVDLYNGMFVNVLEIGEIKYNPTVTFKIKGGETIKRKLSFRGVTVAVENLNGTKTIIQTTLLDFFLTQTEGKLHPYDQRALYIDFKTRMAGEGIRPKTEVFQKMLLKDIFFNALQAKYGYSITCHKAQGGEWTDVFIDFNIFIGKRTNEYFRWIYTAITRSNKRILTIEAPSFDALSEFKISENIDKITKIPKGSSFSPDLNQPFSFVEYRKKKLQDLFELENINVTSSEAQNQLKLSISMTNENAQLILWYSNGGFSKVNWESYSSDNFKNTIIRVLKKSLIPERIEFNPQFEFQMKMHEYFTSTLTELNIPLQNIVQNENLDRYFLQTNADCAYVDFYYKKSKGIYTNAFLKSTLGEEDYEMLELYTVLNG